MTQQQLRRLKALELSLFSEGYDPMFDRSLLSPAQLEFVTITDTHYMLDPGDRPLEFESRRKQTARAEVALRLAASLKPDFVVHLGDIAQEYPDTDRFRQARNEALRQMEQCGVKARHVPGNQDVGDKPDPTMPARPVRPESLAQYHAALGPSWYSFDRADCHFIVLNSQILNADLPEAESQRAWLEADLSEHRGARIFLFLHLPPYLWDENEPGLGHYDNIDQPARAWLLQLVRRYRMELVTSGHVHFAFFDRIDGTRYRTLAAPTFTRPGFSHLFTGAPPPEQGRDDTGKFGFYLLRVLPGRTDVHFIRTAGALGLPARGADAPARLITRTSAGLPQSPLGLSLRHPLASATEVPVAWPSAVRQRVRNDYPLLSCLELGATSVRTPWTDLADPLQARRLAILRDEGVRITAILLWPPPSDLRRLLQPHLGRVDAWEIQVPGTPIPPEDLLDDLKACRSLSPLTLALSPAVPGERQEGKQIPRTRIGYRPEELETLNRRLAEKGLRIDRALCRIDAGVDPWDVALAIRDLPTFSHIGGIDLAVELPWTDDAENADRAAGACFAAALLPGCMLYLEPFIDFDRTMDANHGLLDTLCNPRPAFHVLRCLNTVLYGPPRPVAPLQPIGGKIGPIRVRTLIGKDAAFCLLLSNGDRAPIPQDLPLLPGIPEEAPIRLYRLGEGTVETGPRKRMRRTIANSKISFPLLLTTACT